MSRGDTAKNYFLEGYNCAQAVCLAFKDEISLDEATIARLTGGFGGGIGRMREVCGTVSGMAFVLSSIYGYENANDTAQKAELYERIQELGERFRADNGSIVCRELLNLQQTGASTPTPAERTSTYYQKRPCKELVKYAADILEEYLSKNK